MKKQHGSSHIILVVVILVALLGTLGYVFWQSAGGFVNTSADPPVNERTTENTVRDMEPGYTPVIPDGWEIRTSEEPKLQYAASQGEEVSFSIYKVGEMIHVGFGAPVFVRYLASEGWRSYEADNNNQPTVDGVLEIPSVSTKVQDKYNISYYDTGDGMRGETRALVVAGAKIYQFTFVENLKSEEFVSDFAKTIVID